MTGDAVGHVAAGWLDAFARATGFAATVPLGLQGAVPRVVRAALALALTPLCAAHGRHPDVHAVTLSGVAGNVLIGASFGLAAAMVAGAAGAAGAAIDAVLGSRVSVAASSGATGGALERSLACAFACAFFSSGVMTHLCVRFAEAAGTMPATVTGWGAAHLADASFSAALSLAAPALIAQAVCTIVAGVAARAAPRINGLMLSSPLTCAAVVVILAAGARPLFTQLLALARIAASTRPL